MESKILNKLSNIIRFNMGTVIKFEILFKVLLALIFMPLALFGFNLSMKLTGYTYLTLENVFGFILNPLTIILLLFIFIFLTMITLFDISTLIIIFDESYHRHKITLNDAIKISFKKCIQLFKLKNISIIFFIIFLIPFLNIGISSNVISSISIPEFILDYIKANTVLSTMLGVLYLFLAFLLMKWIYSLHYMILEDNDFKTAKEKSKNLIEGNILKNQIKIFFTQFLITLFYILFILFGILIIVFLNKIFNNIKIVKSIFIAIIWVFIAISLIISSIISTSISYAVISILYYQDKNKKGEKIKAINHKSVINDKTNNALKYAIYIIIFLSIIGGSIFTYQVITGKANLNIEFVREMEITAHRGASVNYPENTMAAFRGAKELGADWIELDVQQTKDKRIIVSHDTNLSRVTGVNKNIIDLNYDEIKDLDAGSFFSKEFKGEKIPLLEEVVEFAKENNIRLNIELKPTGKEVDFEKYVLEIIDKYDYKENCVITSQTYSVLENVKNIDSSFKTVYVMSIAIGNIVDLKYADAFSVEASNVNRTLVKKVHNDGKELYAWTVNTEDSINKMIDMGVDNIITDNISLGKELVIKSRNSNLINEFIKVLQ